MDNQRIFLWLALLFVLWLNVDAWMKDYGTSPAPATVTATTATDENVGRLSSGPCTRSASA